MRHGCVITPDTVLNSTAFLDTERLTNFFISTFANALDSVAYLIAIRPKLKQEPRLNDATHAASQECRWAEQRWKNDRLEVSYQILKESWRNYQSVVKAEKCEYLSDLISCKVG